MGAVPGPRWHVRAGLRGAHDPIDQPKHKDPVRRSGALAPGFIHAYRPAHGKRRRGRRFTQADPRVQLVKCAEEQSGPDGCWIGAAPALAEKLVREALRRGLVPELRRHT